MTPVQQMIRETLAAIEAQVAHATEEVSRFLWRNSRLLRPRPRLTRARVVSSRR